jgi:hypothetical protein
MPEADRVDLSFLIESLLNGPDVLISSSIVKMLVDVRGRLKRLCRPEFCRLNTGFVCVISVELGSMVALNVCGT